MSTKHQRILLFVLLAGSIALTNSSCTKNNNPGNGNNGNGHGINIGDSAIVVGNGDTTSQVRTPGNFTAVNISGVGTVNITPGPTLQVTVTDDSNLLPLVQTTVNNNVLTVGYKPNTSIIGGHLVTTIVMPTLVGTSIAGAGTFNVNGNFVVNGVFTTTIAGSGTINLNGGSADSLSANINGSGLINALPFPVRAAYVSISGSGEADVAVSTDLTAIISGSGSVRYTGNPTVTQKISGLGSVVKN